ncbi:MAG: shikimate kinase [Chloroflexota bacterium]|jgi:shikimate kinase|nr:shikimate kinase [Chloroflexota bacterium]
MPGNLVLVGYMGSGKSTVGVRVAALLGLAFIDLDDLIEDGAGTSIAEIFRTEGEAHFRDLEASTLEQVLAGEGRVVATGGGAPMNDDSWGLMVADNTVVHLDASADSLVERVGLGDGRPLLEVGRDDPERLRERLVAILERRRGRYAQAPYRVDTTGRSIDEVVLDVVAVARDAGINGTRDAGG